MPRDLILLNEKNEEIVVKPSTLKEFFICNIVDPNGYETRLWHTTPYAYNSCQCQWYIGTKRDHEYKKAQKKQVETAHFIMKTNPEGQYPFIYDIGDGNPIIYDHLRLWRIQSYYPAAVIDAPVKEKEGIDFYSIWNANLPRKSNKKY